MKKLPLDELKEGMILAKPIADASGRTLLAAGAVLSENYIGMMGKKGIGGAFVEGGEDGEDGYAEAFPVVGYDVFTEDWDTILAEIHHKFELVQDNVVMLQMKKAIIKYLEELKERYG